MPKSKRNKQIELAKTKKRGLDWKKGLFEEVRSCVDKYTNAFVFLVNDMRNSKMKTVREQWKHSRFFIGKNKIMAMALGRSAEEEYKPNLHKLGKEIKGQCGLLFSNKPIEEVLSWFRSYSEGDYARSGNAATETVNLTQGPLAMFPHNLEPYLRQLGLPTTLEKGVIHLIKDHEVCKEGDVLTPETARILKLLGYEMAEFHITIACVWSQDGSFMQFLDPVSPDSKQNKNQAKKSSFGSKATIQTNTSDLENMEIETDVDILSETKHNILEPFVIDTVCHTNTPISKCSSENGISDLEELHVSPISQKMDDIADGEASEDNDPSENEDEIESSVSDLQKDKNSIECKLDDAVVTVDHNEYGEKENTNEHNEQNHLDITSKTPKTEKTKRESILKTPDANTSQDSPVFRELRSRSVKINRKRK